MLTSPAYWEGAGEGEYQHLLHGKFNLGRSNEGCESDVTEERTRQQNAGEKTPMLDKHDKDSISDVFI